MEKFRRKTLRKIQAHPSSETLSKLIFERMPMDALELLAPIILESNRDDRSNFDSMTPTSPTFCCKLLNRHYKSDRILELVGKEFEGVNRRKPEKLSDLMSIIQKRIHLKKNRKAIIPKVTMEFESKEPFVRLSESYIFTMKESKPQGFEYSKEGVDMLIFKINRVNDDRQPKIELVDCQSDLLERVLFKDPRYEDEDDGGDTFAIIAEPYVLEDYQTFGEEPEMGDFANRLFNLNTLCGEMMKDRVILTEFDRFGLPLSGNLSRQRAWQDYLSCPRTVHPLLKYDEDEENDFIDFHRGSVRRTLEFHRFIKEKTEIACEFELEFNCYLENVCSRFIEDGNWLIYTDRAYPGDRKLFHVDLNCKEVSEYTFPRWFDTRKTQYGIKDNIIYFAREMETANSKIIVFGHLVNQDFDELSSENDPIVDKASLWLHTFNHLFFAQRQDKSDKAMLKIGIDGLLHIVLEYTVAEEDFERTEKTEVYTIPLKEMMKLLHECEKLTVKDNDSKVTYTLPVINLEDFCIPRYQDQTESPDDWCEATYRCDVGYMDGNKLHILV